MATQSKVDLSAYKNLYLQTGREHIGVIRNGLLMVRLNPDDKDSIGKMHISVHSLKGSSMAMGYQKTALYCRLIEYIFRDALEKNLTLSPELTNGLKEAVTQIENSLRAIEKSNLESDLTTQEKALEKLSGVKIPVIN